MRTLAVVNQKGGVGKSTLVVHLAHAAIEAKMRVLLVDMDRQGSLSMSFEPVEGAAPGLPASELFSADVPTGAPEWLSDRVAIIRADDTLSLLNGGVADAAKRPARNLRQFDGQFDVCLIDTPGAIGFNPPTTVAALVASDAVVCPFSLGLYEGKALADLWGFLSSIRTAAYNPRLRLMGLLPSMINTVSRKEMAQLAELRAHKQIGKHILPHQLAKRAAVKQAIMDFRPVWKGSKGGSQQAIAREWRAVCKHILGDLVGVAK